PRFSSPGPPTGPSLSEAAAEALRPGGGVGGFCAAPRPDGAVVRRVEGGAAMTDTWSDLMWTAVHNVTSRLIVILPGLLAMLTLAAIGLGGGWLIGRLARRLARTAGFGRRADAWGLHQAME